MIKLVDILKEIENDPAKKLSGDDLKKYQAALALLQKQGDTLEEGLKDSLKKLGMSAAVVAALMASPNLSSAQKAAVKDVAPTTQTTATPQGTYAGNSKMDQKSFRDAVLKQYKAINPSFWVGGDEDVKKVQQAIKLYRAVTLQNWKDGKTDISSGGEEISYKKADDATRKRIEQGFMEIVPKTEEDGKNGQFTSRFRFPGSFLKDVSSGIVTNMGVRGNTVIQDLAKDNISVEQMNEWNKFVDWMKSPTSQK